MAKMQSYTFAGNGSTRGKSGRVYRYRAGVPVVAPAGEFDHLGAPEAAGYTVAAADYETRPMVAGAVEAPLPPGADPERDVMVSATPGTPPDPAASQAGFPAEQGATLSEGDPEADKNFDDSPKAGAKKAAPKGK